MSFAILLVASQPLAIEPELRWPSHSEMDVQLRECAVQHFTIRYDDDLQSDVIELRETQVTDEQLSCVNRAADYTPYLVLWSEADVGARYYKLSERLARPRALARAQAYFDERPELGEPPLRKERQTELDFARSIERFCGPDALGTFAVEYGKLTLLPQWPQEGAVGVQPSQLDAFGCAYMASVLRELPIGFFGNEKAAEPDD